MFVLLGTSRPKNLLAPRQTHSQERGGDARAIISFLEAALDFNFSARPKFPSLGALHELELQIGQTGFVRPRPGRSCQDEVLA